ncbi:MCE family protein [Prescottella agglutinans]|uniref:Phospholipid/cholesterol/gamma-HCH transport system substrate-binding protein n=1 Tax=Prescottella agglutinans TaxID=1644129 RepID=A0ABT6MDN9_9NOCA|nr:MCE family protein [Prescottella agglutinans]MDH6282438.1 phospholipid/cholesterol/gamma-HCH transport system substrate-binding protein [Prescottella agglutinans]
MRRRVLAATAAAGGALLLTGCGIGIQDLPLGRSVPGENYTVTVQLAHADGILTGAEVRTGQRVIGRVSGLSTDTVGAAVDLSLSSTVELPDNVEAAIELPSALSSPFVRLKIPQEPSGTALADGDVIVQSRTEIGPQIESALATLGTILTGSGFDQLRTVIDELDTAFAGRSQKVRGLLDTMTQLTGTATEHRDDFGAAIDLARNISAQLVEQQDVLDGFLDTVPEATTILARQRDRLAALLESSARLAEHAEVVLSSTSLDGIVADGATVVETLCSYNSRIGETLTNMNTFLGNFDRAVKGDYLVFDGNLDVPAGIENLLTGGMTARPGGAGSLPTLLSGGAR